jgi:hypothetical protein
MPQWLPAQSSGFRESIQKAPCDHGAFFCHEALGNPKSPIDFRFPGEGCHEALGNYFNDIPTDTVAVER